MNSRTPSEHVEQIIWCLKAHGWYNTSASVADVARNLNAIDLRTTNGEPWNEANLQAFADEHDFSRDPYENMIPMVVTVDEPGLFEMAAPEIAGALAVTDGMRNARVISRYIEKGEPENRERLWKAIEDDSEVRAEVIRFAALMLDHPWAAKDYQAFLDHARAVEEGRGEPGVERAMTL